MNTKLLSITILITIAMLYPFSCTPQVGVPVGGDGCDTIFIEDPGLNEQIENFQQMIERLTVENQTLMDENAGLKTEVTGLESTVAIQVQTISERDSEILNQKKVIATNEDDIATLEAKVTELENRPPETVTDTIYKELDYITVAGTEYKVSDIELIRPYKAIDTVTVTHCADSTKNTTWFHHGGVSGYPHDITFATKEYGMTRITFKDSLTNEIKVQKSYRLKRTRDYTEAKTLYEFIN